MFDFKKFLKEGGVEKYLLEAQFGNDIESRYQYIRPLMSRLPDSARTEAMIDGMEEARAEDDKMAFDFYFVETMKMLGLETELMEADIFDNLAENDKVLDEFLQMPAQEEEEEEEEGANIEVLDDVEELEIEKEQEVTININLQENMITPGDKVFFRTDTGMKEPMKVVKVRRMLGTNFLAATVEDMDGKIVGEYDDTQLVKFPEKKYFNPEEKANVFVREEVNEIFGFGKSVKYVDGGPDKYGLPPTLKSGAKEVNGTPEFIKTRMAGKIEQIVSDTKDLVKAKGKEKGSSAYGTPGKLRALVTKTIAGPGDPKFGEFNEEDSFFVHLTDRGGNTQIFFNFLEQQFKKDPEIAASLQTPDMFPEKDSITLSLKADKVLSEAVEGEVQSEAMSDQLKINKLLQAANTIEDSLNDVNLELTDDQIDKFTEMILDLRAKAKAKLK